MSIELPPDDPRLPGPTPGLATAAASPAAVNAPAFAADDPGSIAIAIAAMVNELGVPASVHGSPFGGAPLGTAAGAGVPVPAPDRVLAELGLPSTISPAVSPQLVGPGEPIAPSLGALPAQPGDPQPDHSPVRQPRPLEQPRDGHGDRRPEVSHLDWQGDRRPAAAELDVPAWPHDQGARRRAASDVPTWPHDQGDRRPAASDVPTWPHDQGDRRRAASDVPTWPHDRGDRRPAASDLDVPTWPHDWLTSVPALPDPTPQPVVTLGAPSIGTPGTGAVGTPASPFGGTPSFDAALLGFHDVPVHVPLFESSERPNEHSNTPASVRPSPVGAFDPYLVRKDFPILEERVHGKRLVWLDNGATTQKPRAVIERLAHFYEHENSNVHRAAHALAARATDAFESARETTRKFLNAPSTSEVIFVRGATEGINLIAKTWGKRHLERGDEIVLTHLEHHANIVPWQQLCAETGARLRVAPVNDRGELLLDEYEKLLCSKTKLVAFTAVSNALGTITPAKQIIESAHRWGACTVLDGAQAVSHMPVDVQALDCDFYVFSGHKVFAPTGIGAVFGKRAILDAMPPWQGGGNMIADVTFEKTVYQPPPWRFEAGTGNIADAAGLGAALDYVMRIGMATIDRYEHDLLGYATAQLATVPGLRMIGTAREKAGVMSFVLDGKRTEDVGSALDKDGIAVRSGHHCAQPILRRFGLEATIRASLAFYNVKEDIDMFVASLKRLQSASV